MKPVPVLTATLACLLLLSACGGSGRPPGVAGNESPLVGGPCMNATECEKQLCEPTIPTAATNFPGGMCTISCGNSGQCPSKSSCGELESGWVCLVDCTTTADCRTQYSCQAVIEAGTNGGSTKMVCLGSVPTE